MLPVVMIWVPLCLAAFAQQPVAEPDFVYLFIFYSGGQTETITLT